MPVNPADWIVEEILPAREIHLIGGPSGGGKTTWLLQMIMAWIESKPIFGYPSHPKDFAYISCDRSEAGARRTFERVHIPPNFPFVSGIELGLNSVESIADYVCKRAPTIRVLFVEGFAALAPASKSSHDYSATARWLSSTMKLSSSRDLTFFGSVHSPKMREKERYANPRQRILSSVAWAAFTETIILVELVNEEDENSLRRITLLPRNVPAQSFEMAFKDGLLVPATPQQLDSVSAMLMGQYIGRFRPDDIFTTAQAVEYGETKNLSKSTVMRWLQAAVECQILYKIGHGRYRVLPPPPIV